MEKLNKVRLSGRTCEVGRSHKYVGKQFYSITLVNIRPFGISDRFQIIIEKSIMGNDEYEGKEILVTGSFRSFNISKEPGKRHNVNYIYADSIKLLDGPAPGGDINEIEFIARNCSQNTNPVKVGENKVLNLLLTISRSQCRWDAVYCSLWNSLAEKAGALKKGDCVKISGRLLSREMLKNAKDLETVYEVSAKEMEILEDEK